MNVQTSKWILVAAVLGGLAVACGAFGAHWLEDLLALINSAPLEADALQERHEWLETGVRYHMYHALALLVVGVLQTVDFRNKRNTAAICFLLGIAFFSLPLYALALTGIRVIGAVVVIGGILFLIGWTWLALSAIDKR